MEVNIGPKYHGYASNKALEAQIETADKIKKRNNNDKIDATSDAPTQNKMKTIYTG